VAPGAQVLDLLDFVPTETHAGQVRGGGPVHGSTSSPSRSFSANLGKHTSRCFQCASQGNQLDWWAAATHQGPSDAVLDRCDKLSVKTARLDSSLTASL
jgi:hypothetical protein